MTPNISIYKPIAFIQDDYFLLSFTSDIDLSLKFVDSFILSN